MATNGVVYDDNSMSQQKGATRIRKRPASMLGSSGLAGARHGFTEIYGNALDEASSGFGDKLDVKYYKDGSISLRDYGRGVPLGWNENEQTHNWHLIYNELYGGGKYESNQWYLASIDKWSSWSLQNSDIIKSLGREIGMDVLQLEVDRTYTFNDIEIERDEENVKVHALGVSWSNVTWDMLNNRLNYLASVGLNGLGAASTQYTSEYFTVKSYRSGVCTEMNFVHGIPLFDGKPVNVFESGIDIKDYPAETYPTDEPDGTFIHWKPDELVFTDVNVGGDWLFEVCQDVADVAHINLHFEDEQSGIVKDLEAGDLGTLVEHRYGDSLLRDDNENPIILSSSAINHGSIVLEGNPFVWVCKADVVFSPVKKAMDNSCFHNSVRMGDGVQYYAINNAFRNFFSKHASGRGLKLERSDYDGVFVAVVSSYSNYASFKGQTKDEVDNAFVGELVEKAITDKLNIEFGKGNPVVVDAVNRVLEEAEMRIQIKEAAKKIKEVNKITKQKKPDKFKTCRAYMEGDSSIAELWITEGDSASGAVDDARDSSFQAVFPVRGKCLNVLKNSYDRILANEEIKGIFALIETGMDIGQEGLFDITKLRFDKIIFATDADEDGYQIRVLLFLIFYKLAPELLRQGHVYIAETPRFELKLSDGSRIYAKDDEERDRLREEYRGRVTSISRFKGLGEVNEDVLSETTVAPETRNLVQLKVDVNDNNVREVVDALFGADKYHQRKAILTNVLGSDVKDMFEENALLIKSIDEEDIEEDTKYQIV